MGLVFLTHIIFLLAGTMTDPEHMLYTKAAKKHYVRSYLTNEDTRFQEVH